jgi:hypothetical protein
MNSEEIFSASLEVIESVKRHTTSVPLAMRILDAAKSGFEGDPPFSGLTSRLEVVERPDEGI